MIPTPERLTLAVRLDEIDTDIIDATDEVGGIVYDLVDIASSALSECQRLEAALAKIAGEAWGSDPTGRIIRVRHHLREAGYQSL